MEKKLTYTALMEDEGSKLQALLQKRMGLSRKEISRAKFREQGICVNGRRCKVHMPIHAGDQITVLLETKEETSSQLIACGGQLSVLYEDADVLVVEKPAGLVVHPVGAYYMDTLANRLAAYLRKKGEDSVIRILGRLDKETSGVVLAVKNRAAASRLERQREKGEFRKTYLAVTEGVPQPQAGWIRTPIGKDPTRKGKMRTCPEGKPAATCYEVLAEKENRALVILSLATGRTHQIRVHMASVGCPLTGDPLYGIVKTGNDWEKQGDSKGPERMALHAVSLRFLQPFTGKEIIVETSLPDFVKTAFPGIAYCGFSAPVLE